MHARLFASLFCLSVLGLSSCGGDDPPGSLIVPFEIGAGVQCTTFGVTEVTVTLKTMSASGGIAEEIASEVVPCDDRQAEFTGLAAGRYEVVATGVDTAGVVIVDNGGKKKPDIAEVTSGAENTADVVNMSATPAQIHVRWTLNGGFGQCSDVPATGFVVGAYDNGGASLLHEYVFDCDPDEPAVGGYNIVVDEDRDVEGDEVDLITVNPVDAMGKSVVATKLSFAMMPPGHGRIIKLTAALDCTMSPCTITCPNNDGMGNCLPD